MTLQQPIVLVLQASILMTVFLFGMQTTLADLLYVVRSPSLLGRSLVAMFVIMPIIAVAMVRALALHPAVEIALVALAISPVPPLLPMRQQTAGGHASYGLGLMAIAGMLSIVTVPAALDLLGRYFVRPFAISPGAIASIVLKVAILPLAAGVVFRAMWPSAAARLVKPVGLVGRVLLAIGVLAILAGAMPEVIALARGGAVVAMAAFVAAGLAVGHWLGGPDADHRLVLALSTAIRHPAIALAIGKVNFPNEPRVGAAILLFVLVGALVAIPYLVRQRRRVAKSDSLRDS